MNVEECVSIFESVIESPLYENTIKTAPATIFRQCKNVSQGAVSTGQPAQNSVSVKVTKAYCTTRLLLGGGLGRPMTR